MDSRIEILLDTSTSMGSRENNGQSFLLPDGRTRIGYAKQVLLDHILPGIEYVNELTIRTFKQRHYQDDFTQEQKSELEVISIYQGSFRHEKIISTINTIPEDPWGGTPIAAALEVSLNHLKQFPKDDRQIILITDGKENGGGDYRQVIRDAKRENDIDFKIHLIGIMLDGEQKEEAKSLVESIGGTFVHIKEKNISSGKDQEKIKKLTDALAARSITVVKETSPTSDTDGGDPKPVDNSDVNQSGNEEDEVDSINWDDPEDYPDEPPLSAAPNSEKRLAALEAQIKKQDKTIQVLNSQLKTLNGLLETILKREKRNFPRPSRPLQSPVSEKKLRKIGRAAEKHVYQKLKKHYGKRLTWNNKKRESGKPYDLFVQDEAGNPEFFVEVKGTIRQTDTPIFFITAQEWNFFLANPYQYRLYLVREALRSPQIIKVNNLLEALLEGRIVPYALQDMTLAAQRVMLQYVGTEEEE